MQLGIEKTATTRVRAGIGYALDEATKKGHCGLPVDELRPLAAERLEVDEDRVRTALDLERVVCGRRWNPTSRLTTYSTETLYRRAGRRRTPGRSPASAERGFRTPRAPRSSPSRTHRAVPSGADCRSGTESSTATRREAHPPERRRAVRLRTRHRVEHPRVPREARFDERRRAV